MDELDNQDASPTTDLQPKRTTSFAARFKDKKKPGPPVATDLKARIAQEREKTKYWARVLLLFPLVPVCAALITITIGGVVINVATDQCNSMLMRFLQGAVVLSYILVAFYTYCWMGPKPIKRLRTVKVFYFLYGLVCVIWWGLYGTMQAVTATSSGFESCLSMSPALYIMAQYEVAVFWIIFVIGSGYVALEITADKREAKLTERREKKRRIQLAKARADAEAREQALKLAQEEAREAEEEQRKKLAAEQERLFLDSDEEDEGNGGAKTHPIDPDSHNNMLAEDMEDGDEDEEDEVELPSTRS